MNSGFVSNYAHLLIVLPLTKIALPSTVSYLLLADFNSDVAKFWRSLFPDDPNYPDVGEEWIFLKNVSWLGEAFYGNALFIRSVYKTFWEIINDKHKLWVVTGTPGSTDKLPR